MNKNEFMVKSTIEEIEFVLQDYWWLKTNRAFICMNNPVSVLFEGREMNLEDVGAENIVGHEVISEKLSEEESFSFVLDNGYTITLSLRRADYSCPEAMSIDYFSGHTIIFN